VFAASVNDRNFLIDDTGNTRWWVVECLDVDYRHGLDIQQIWAEVYECFFARDEIWWLTRDEEKLLEEQNKEYRVVSAVEDLLSRRLMWKDPKFMWTYRTVTETLIEVGVEKPTPGDIQKASRHIKEMTGQESIRVGRNRARVYLLPPPNKHPNGEDIEKDEDE
jgi:putative DNA primase/helicase